MSDLLTQYLESKPPFLLGMIRQKARAEALEEAAQECIEWAETVEAVGEHPEQAIAYRNAAAAIRDLSQSPRPESDRK